PVLIDFDVAVHEGDTIEVNENEGQIRGSAPYAGPELVKDGATITRKLNTWQVAAIAFEMLTHERFMNITKTRMILKYSFDDEYNKFLESRLHEVNLPQ